MIYEILVISKASAGESAASKVQSIVEEVASSCKGKVLLHDVWGHLNFAQKTSKKESSGYYSYFIVKVDGEVNKEITRRFRINEDVLKQMIFKVGEDEEEAELLKAYKTPFSKKYPGSVTDDSEEREGREGREKRDSGDRDKKRLMRSREHWFKANGFRANWKDPKTYSWLVNDFGKISPARVTDISRKHQRFATTAIKRARNLGLISHISNKIASAK